MRRPLLVLVATHALASVACSGPDETDHTIERRAEELVGGTAIGPETHPAAVIWMTTGVYCTGTFITPSHILTAAHCTRGHVAPGVEFRFGRETQGYLGLQKIGVTAVYEHPQYSDFRYDAAVIQLEAPASSATMAVETGSTEEGAYGVEAVGYGCQTSWGSTDGMVRKLGTGAVAVPMGTHLQVARGLVDFSVCPGDSGGPLIANGRIVGIASWGRYDLSFALYARTDLVAPWLAELGLVALPSPGPSPSYDFSGGGW